MSKQGWWKNVGNAAQKWALLLLVVCLPSIAFAFPLQVRVVAKVSEGKQPQLFLFASEAATGALVELSRKDGKSFTYRLGDLSAGQERTVALDGKVGRHEYTGKMKATVAGETMESPLDFVTVVAPPLQIDVTRDDLDLSKGTLRFRASRKVSSAELRVIGIGGEVLSKAEHDVSAANAKENVTLSYRPVPAQDLLRLELRVEDEDGFFRALSLTPWSVHIPHEEVLFATDSAKIRQSEVPKLKDSLQQIITARQRYAQIQGVQLFIAGHTDTRGSSSHNRELSRRRAQAIAAWFVTQGVKLKVFYEGFGESSLKVKTQDEVDEPQNRRVDYILSIEKPALSGGAWRALN